MAKKLKTSILNSYRIKILSSRKFRFTTNRYSQLAKLCYDLPCDYPQLQNMKCRNPLQKQGVSRHIREVFIYDSEEFWISNKKITRRYWSEPRKIYFVNWNGQNILCIRGGRKEKHISSKYLQDSRGINIPVSALFVVVEKTNGEYVQVN